MVQLASHQSHPDIQLTTDSRPAADTITRTQREQQNRHRSFILWLTGLSGAGKSTLAGELERRLFAQDYHVTVLDGDSLRDGLNDDLGFDRPSRQENVRRVGEIARLFMNTGTITICALISPYAGDRDRIRDQVAAGDFIEVFVRCSVEECERRDTKGLYRKARAGLIKGLTGVDDPFEEPRSPHIIIESEHQTVEQSLETILSYLRHNDYLS